MQTLTISPVGMQIEAFNLDCDLTLLGEKLYSLITELTGESSFKLMFRGRIISKDKYLAEQGLKSGAKVLLVKEKEEKKREEQPAVMESTPLDILVSMGYPYDIATRALANVGSGYGAVQKAIDYIERNKKMFEIEEKYIYYQEKPTENKPVEKQNPPPPIMKHQKSEEYPEVHIETNEEQISTVFCWGNGGTGQLGLGEIQLSHSPHNVRALAGIKMASISCGAHHTVGLSSYGNIYTWGRYLYPTNEENQVKYGNKTIPSLLDPVKHIKFSKVSAGSGHTLALDNLGQVWSWGDGMQGQLGHGEKRNEFYPKIIEELQLLKVIDIAAGGQHSACIKDTGEVCIWGRNNAGQLGTRDLADRLSPTIVILPENHKIKEVFCGTWHTVAVSDAIPRIMKWGSGNPLPTRVPMFDDHNNSPRIVSCGGEFTYVLTSFGELFYIPEPNRDNANPNIIKESFTGIINIGCGGTFSLILLQNGNILAKGENKQGQLGVGDFTNRNEWTSVKGLTGIHVESISCGSTHCGAVVRFENLAYDLLSASTSESWSDLNIWSRDDKIIRAHKTLIESHIPFNTLGFEVDYTSEYRSQLNYNELKILIEWLYSGIINSKQNISIEEMQELINYCNQRNLTGLRDLLLERVSEEELKSEHDREFPEYKARETIFRYKQEELKKINQEESKAVAQMDIDQFGDPQLDAHEEGSDMEIDEMQPEVQQVSAEERRRAMIEAIEKRQREELENPPVQELPIIAPQPPVVPEEIPEIIPPNPREAEEKRRKMLEALEKRSKGN
ncbi:unnamed protein product [Blepharisma stoltei]|uniref:Uncharacterized protein n=1 Tax=Blepharisma stoltei TaxID=1481888 RepID=A0AAU9JZ15_9CILI|nr:unnamed protein product [Blepharisma stoltei]